jgi:hypothetical protein
LAKGNSDRASSIFQPTTDFESTASWGGIIMEKQFETQTINRKRTDFKPLAELLSNWFDRHEAEWKTNNIPEEKIAKLKEKVSIGQGGGEK